MKDQYFGDFGDYQKFSLLKVLRDIGNFTILVHWLKTKDDGGSDGNKLTYLMDPVLWGSYDAPLFSFLNTAIQSSKRRVSLYEDSAHAKGIYFIHEYIENKEHRKGLLNRIYKDRDIDLVFFDPDNGIEVKSTSSKTAHKYVQWNEIESTYNSGKSLLIYQHFSRKNRDVFIKEKIEEIKNRIAAEVYTIRVKHSVYFLVVQKKHALATRKSIDHFSTVWGPLAMGSMIY